MLWVLIAETESGRFHVLNYHRSIRGSGAHGKKHEFIQPLRICTCERNDNELPTECTRRCVIESLGLYFHSHIPGGRYDKSQIAGNTCSSIGNKKAKTNDRRLLRRDEIYGNISHSPLTFRRPVSTARDR